MTANQNGTNPGVSEADWDEMVIGPQEIQALSQTEDGMAYLKLFFSRARVAYGVSQLAGYLQHETDALARHLSAEELQYLCNIMWHVQRKTPHAEIQQFVAEAAQINSDKVSNA